MIKSILIFLVLSLFITITTSTQVNSDNDLSFVIGGPYILIQLGAYDTCSSEIESGYYYTVDTCYGNYNFTCDNINKLITVTEFEGENCQGIPTTNTYKFGECAEVNSRAQTFTCPDEITYPQNSLVVVSYAAACSIPTRNKPISSAFYYTNEVCFSSDDGSKGYMNSCLGNTTTEYIYSNNQCSGSYQSNSFPIEGPVCQTDLSIYTFCNNQDY